METVYLNNAATSWPKAPGVAEAVAAELRELPLHAGRIGFVAADPIAGCRGLLAELLHITETRRIVFCSNATFALNIALYGFPWKEGAMAITTAAEHNSVLRPLYYQSKRRGLHVKVLPVGRDGRVDPELWEKTVKQCKPQLVTITHASNVTGAIQPVERLCKIAKEVGATTLLDASQSLGLIDVLPESWGADLVAFTGHKYLLGPPGTGGLYIGPGLELEPLLAGGTGVLSELDEMPPEPPARFEAGTNNEPALIGLGYALQWQKDHPLDRAELLRKTERLAGGLGEIGARVVKVAPPCTPVVSFTLPGWETEEVGEILYKSFNVVCRTGLHCAPKIHRYLETGERGTVRFSLSRFSTDEEIDYALAAVRGILA